MRGVAVACRVGPWLESCAWKRATATQATQGQRSNAMIKHGPKGGMGGKSAGAFDAQKVQPKVMVSQAPNVSRGVTVKGPLKSDYCGGAPKVCHRPKTS